MCGAVADPPFFSFSSRFSICARSASASSRLMTSTSSSALTCKDHHVRKAHTPYAGSRWAGWGLQPLLSGDHCAQAHCASRRMLQPANAAQVLHPSRRTQAVQACCLGGKGPESTPSKTCLPEVLAHKHGTAV